MLALYIYICIDLLHVERFCISCNVCSVHRPQLSVGMQSDEHKPFTYNRLKHSDEKLLFCNTFIEFKSLVDRNFAFKCYLLLY